LPIKTAFFSLIISDNPGSIAESALRIKGNKALRHLVFKKKLDILLNQILKIESDFVYELFFKIMSSFDHFHLNNRRD